MHRVEYTEGSPCKKCGGTARYAHGGCVACAKARALTWNQGPGLEAHRKHINKNNRKVRLKTPEYARWHDAKSRSAKAGLPFNIEISDCIAPPLCPICAREFVRSNDTQNRTRKASPSLDKVDPTLGYVKGNVLVVCLECNKRKQDNSPDGLRKLADKFEAALAEHNAKHYPTKDPVNG